MTDERAARALALPPDEERLATAVGRTRRVAMSDDEYAATVIAAWEPKP